MQSGANHSAGRPSNSLHYAVGIIDGKLDQLILSLSPRLDGIERDAEALSLRVETLEDFMTTWKARSAILTGAITSVVLIIQGAIYVIDKYILMHH